MMKTSNIQKSKIEILDFIHRYWLMMMSLLELDLELRIEKEAGERTKDMKEVRDQKKQRLENLDNPHAVL